jgi:hypothetical protein
MSDDDLFADPETHEKVHRASAAELAAIKEAIAGGRARRRDGKDMRPVESAYVSHGGRWIYPDVDGIPSFLIDERIELDDAI